MQNARLAALILASFTELSRVSFDSVEASFQQCNIWSEFVESCSNEVGDVLAMKREVDAGGSSTLLKAFHSKEDPWQQGFNTLLAASWIHKGYFLL